MFALILVLGQTNTGCGFIRRMLKENKFREHIFFVPRVCVALARVLDSMTDIQCRQSVLAMLGQPAPRQDGFVKYAWRDSGNWRNSGNAAHT